MDIIIVAFFVIFIGFIAIIAAFVVMNLNRKAQSILKPVNVRAEIIKTDTSINNMTKVENFNNYDNTKCFVEFRTDQGLAVVLSCEEKVFYELLPGFYGNLTYQGSSLVSFERLIGHEEARIQEKLDNLYFFEKKGEQGDTLSFWCEAPSLDVHVPTNETIKLDIDEVFMYIDRMYDNNTENFFGLEDDKKIIQFINDGNKDEIIVDVPDITKDGSYQTIIDSTDEAKELVTAFYNKENVRFVKNFEFIKY